METWSGLPPDISGISGTLTGPSHSPARLFRVAKDFCASDCTGATEDFCVSDWAKAVAVTRTNRSESAMRDFIISVLLVFSCVAIAEKKSIWRVLLCALQVDVRVDRLVSRLHVSPVFGVMIRVDHGKDCVVHVSVLRAA